MYKLSYFVKNKTRELTDEDFISFATTLSSFNGVGINIDELNHSAGIFYENTGIFSAIKFEVNAGHGKCIIVELEPSDTLTLDVVRTASTQLGLNIYSPVYQTYLPDDPNLLDSQIHYNPVQHKAKEVLDKLGFRIIFWISGTYLYFAEKIDDLSIHLINDNLLYFFIETGEIVHTSELSFKVADNIQNFVLRYDAGLVPIDFYRYYKRNAKIINHSGFNLNNPGRKVFIKPYIQELDWDKQDFYKIARDGSPLLYMDKIRKGETMDNCIMRIIKDELKVANDYVGAVVTKIIDFDFDRNGELTPRLIVHVYIDKADLTDEQKKQSRQGWVSMKQVNSS